MNKTKTDMWSPTLDKNCGKCYWSTRDPTNLLISCQIGKQIGNTWVTAHNCREYNDIQATKKENPKQQDLFHQQTLF